ncbi:hypothetical protein TCSYLVIO_007466 [Trypanosoma cruzi]|nr:hypothetical protein TCSYLVIO_007466 [Trypanosoma cruzi]
MPNCSCCRRRSAAARTGFSSAFACFGAPACGDGDGVPQSRSCCSENSFGGAVTGGAGLCTPRLCGLPRCCSALMRSSAARIRAARSSSADAGFDGFRCRDCSSFAFAAQARHSRLPFTLGAQSSQTVFLQQSHACFQSNMLKLRAQSGQTDAEVIREKRSRGTSKREKKKTHTHTFCKQRQKKKITGEKQQQKTKLKQMDRTTEYKQPHKSLKGKTTTATTTTKKRKRKQLKGATKTLFHSPVVHVCIYIHIYTFIRRASKPPFTST